MAGIYSQGGSAGHRYAGWLEKVEAKNFQFGGKVFNGSPSAIYVGSNLVWMGGWLSQAAQQAILGAFGQRDGWAVINATNAYLNQLAASDRDKATALAGFINEDHMLVCSLGLEPSGMSIPMPVRMLIANNNAWINTGYQFSGSVIDYEITFRLRTLKNDYRTVTGSQDSSNARVLNVHFTSDIMQVTSGNRGANAGIQISGMQNNTLYRLVASSNATTGYIYANLNGTDYTPLALGGTNNVGRDIPLFCKNHVGTIQEFFDEPVGKFIMRADGQNIRELYPFIRKVNNVATLGMIDVLHDVLYTNAGSGQFTEEFGYMQNGQWVTWTPST